METILDLLPNEHIINFHEPNPVLPDWVGQDLRLIMGAGDLDHGGIPNVQMFSTYDVFFCLPWNNNGDSLRRNVEYILANHSGEKLLCFIDVKNYEQTETFVRLFKGRFSLIDGHGGHCPHLPLQDIQRVLVENGIAMNIFERPDTMMSVAEMQGWLDTGILRFASEDAIACRLYGPGANDPVLLERVRDKTLELIGSSPFVTLSEERLARLPDMTLIELQYICRSLLFNRVMPLNLKGRVSLVAKDWREEPFMEFTVMKETPDLRNTAIIDSYINENGQDAIIERINMIVDAIIHDLDAGIMHARAKYRTLKGIIAKIGT